MPARTLPFCLILLCASGQFAETNAANPPAQPRAQPARQTDGSLSLDILNRVKDASVFIQVKLGANAQASGSGFVIHVGGDDVFVVTNHHVIDVDREATPPIQV